MNPLNKINKILVATFISILLNSLSINVAISQGLIPTDESEYNEYTAWDPSNLSLDRGIDFGISEEEIKSRLEKYANYSLREFCPIVLNQGIYNNCVGWTVAYLAMSTQVNFKLNIKNNDLKYLLALDPNQLSYATSKKTENWAFESANFATALNYAKKTGISFRINSSVAHIEQSKNSKLVKISKWDRVKFDENLNKTIKSAIVCGKPVLFGLPLTNDFYEGGCITPDGILKDLNSDRTGYQAMCIVGYNDSINGGSFEVVTSYGNQFGDEGFIYIPYELFKKEVKEGFVFDVIKPFNESNLENEINLGKFTFESGKDLELHFIKESEDTFYIGGVKNEKKTGMGALISNNEIIIYDNYPNIYSQESEIKVEDSFMEFFSIISMMVSLN